jgi:hypothetical protein
MVCVMALAALATVVMNFLGTGGSLAGSVVSNPAYFAIAAADLLVTLLAYLKFVLPGWEPHRKTLGWLLGLSLLGTLAQTIYLTSQGAQIGASAAGDILGDDPALSGIMRGSVLVGGVIGGVIGVGMSPFLYLLIGVCNKKSMEKVAGVFAAISLSGYLLVIPLSLLLSRLAEMPNLLPTYIPAFVGSVGATVLYFTWPVLDRPVLEKTA